MKISPEEREKIWHRYKNEEVSQKELARQYGVTQGLISQIVNSDPNYGPTKEWVKPIARTRSQVDVAQEGFEKVVGYAREDGMTVQAIADAAGMTHAQINRILKRRKVSKPTREEVGEAGPLEKAPSENE